MLRQESRWRGPASSHVGLTATLKRPPKRRSAVKISRLQSSEKGNEKASLPILRGDADVRP
jgi:hypothetical protein